MREPPPLVITASHGGPYPDDAVGAGFQIGCLYAVLAAGPDELEFVVADELVHQADLLAMFFDYRCERGHTHHGHTHLRLTASSDGRAAVVQLIAQPTRFGWRVAVARDGRPIATHFAFTKTGALDKARRTVEELED